MAGVPLFCSSRSVADPMPPEAPVTRISDALALAFIRCYDTTDMKDGSPEGTSGHPLTSCLMCLSSELRPVLEDRKSTRLNSSHQIISYAVFCLKKKKIAIRNLFLE